MVPKRVSKLNLADLKDSENDKILFIFVISKIPAVFFLKKKSFLVKILDLTAN